MSTVRNVIVHYHLFKNAGTSIDHLLRRNFPDRWMSYDGETPGCIIAASELARLIDDNPGHVAFSSHQIVPPLPVVDANIFPIVFLRDPIDRIKSAYLFEWKKQLGLDQPKGSLVEFIQQKFTYVRKSSVEDFQAIRMSNADSSEFVGTAGSDDEILDRACSFISSLDYVGIVDEFDRSNQLLSEYLKPAFPEFAASEVKANVLQDISVSNTQKRQAIRDEIGDELYEMIVARNSLDEALYQHARKHFAALCAKQLPVEQNQAA